jgi:hypothetical protein
VGLDIRYNIHNDTFPLKHGNFWGDFVEGLSPFLIPVIGGTVGYFIGYNYSYQFNP